jgi:hypothetical protein
LIDETKDRTDFLSLQIPHKPPFFYLGMLGKPVNNEPLFLSENLALPTPTTWHIEIGSYLNPANTRRTDTHVARKHKLLGCGSERPDLVGSGPRSKTTISGNLQVQGVIAPQIRSEKLQVWETDARLDHRSAGYVTA